MRRRRRGCVSSLVGLALVCAVLFGLDYGAKALLFAPWAYGVLGRPTLTGGWTGILTAHEGARYAIYLRLDYNQDSKFTPLGGRLSWCTRGVPSTTATVAGNANWSGSDVKFTAYTPLHPHPGLQPSAFRGTWHGDTLVLRVELDLYQNHAYVMSSDLPDEVRPVLVTLQKRGYSVYQAACSRI